MGEDAGEGWEWGVEVSPLQDRVEIDGNRLGDLVTPVCGSRTVLVDDVRSLPGKIVSGRISFCFRRPRGHQGSWARRKASPFKTTVCILLWNYVFYCGIKCMLLRNYHFHIVAEARRALVLNGNWS